MTESGVAEPEVEQQGEPAAKRSRLHRVLAGRPRPRRWQWLLIGAAGAGLVAGAVFCCSMQSPMPIGSVVIEGASADLLPQVSSALALTDGQSFSSIDESAAVQRITAIEGVRGADLQWSRWNTLTVRIDERAPVGLFVDGNGAFVVVGADGVPIRTVPARPAGLLVVQAGDDARRALGLQVSAQVPAELVAGADAVVVDGPQAVSLRMQSGATVVLGDAEDLAAKLRVAQQLLAGTQAKVINVSVPDRPAVSDLPPPPRP